MKKRVRRRKEKKRKKGFSILCDGFVLYLIDHRINE